MARTTLRGPGTLVAWTGLLMLLWLVLHGGDPVGLGVGLLAAFGAVRLGLRLTPPWLGRVAPLAVLQLAGRFLWQSVVGGVDVARRVFDPRLPLRLGFVACRVRVPAGMAEDAFTALASLVPGTLATSVTDRVLLVHCLDRTQPVQAQLATDQALLARACGWPIDARIRHD